MLNNGLSLVNSIMSPAATAHTLRRPSSRRVERRIRAWKMIGPVGRVLMRSYRSIIFRRNMNSEIRAIPGMF